eukprot:CAMPEP_0179038444 /NCGR_PEP_ID=MMETSP0796-20121207/14638_1 /TAXON_ID=73915 /ORGANISM="Pyrodinium bahamense, Strain pbaha01" /LENGTH=111 /DNA_ID=CAMNT_0020734765 /DNA_START=722 /DNA_END=1054 /DNA_ORIENTATION=-
MPPVPSHVPHATLLPPLPPAPGQSGCHSGFADGQALRGRTRRKRGAASGLQVARQLLAGHTTANQLLSSFLLCPCFLDRQASSGAAAPRGTHHCQPVASFVSALPMLPRPP